MKEIKNFFAENNRLNKGYIKITNPTKSDHSFYRKKFAHILPPTDLMEEYENIHPGTLAKLINMAEKEQTHRHTMNLKNLEIYERVITKAKICSVILVIFACVTTLLLTLLGYFISAGIFIIAVSSTIGIISYMSHKKITKTKDYNHK